MKSCAAVIEGRVCGAPIVGFAFSVTANERVFFCAEHLAHLNDRCGRCFGTLLEVKRLWRFGKKDSMWCEDCLDSKDDAEEAGLTDDA